MPDEVEKEFYGYFQELFTSSSPSQSLIQAALQEMPLKVTPAMNSHLEDPFTAEDVTDALAQMCPTKAPGPDGLPAVFFQKHWQTFRGGRVKTCLHILNEQEVFSNMLMQAEKKKLIKGLKFANDVSISHLLFADDSLVFSRASVTDCQHLKEVFDYYAEASGQIFNFEKSSLFFSCKIPAGQIAAIKGIFKLNVFLRYQKYLGLPSMIGKKKMSFFKEIKLKVLNKISSWQHRWFSSGGKEVLIKAAAQAIPAYAMSVFKLLRALCEDIQKAIAKFWWGSKDDKHGIHWTRWDKISQAKSRGGLGFRDFTSFNQAMVAKQGWRLLQFPNSLVLKVMQARYYWNSDFLRANIGSNPSFIWRSIIWGRQVIKKGMRWRIGNGKKISVY